VSLRFVAAGPESIGHSGWQASLAVQWRLWTLLLLSKGLE
jgi:hypothetical protein